MERKQRLVVFFIRFDAREENKLCQNKITFFYFEFFYYVLGFMTMPVFVCRLERDKQIVKRCFFTRLFRIDGWLGQLILLTY